MWVNGAPGGRALPTTPRGRITALPKVWKLGCTGGTYSVHLEQISTLPKVWELGYKAGE
jgi:hypothetical protein